MFKKISKSLIALLLILSFILPLGSRADTENISVNNLQKNEISGSGSVFRSGVNRDGNADADERYGITSVDVDDFKFYVLSPYAQTGGVYTDDEYVMQSAMKMTWAIPAEAKEGDFFTLTIPKYLSISRRPTEDEIFFKIKDIDNEWNEWVIMNVYYTTVQRDDGTGNLMTENALKFVVTADGARYTTAVKGTALVGERLSQGEKDRIKNVTDLAHGKMDKDTAIAALGNEHLNKGLMPNFKWLRETDQANGKKTKMRWNGLTGSTGSGEDEIFNMPKLYFHTRYMNFKEFTLDDETTINYSTMMDKYLGGNWGSALAAVGVYPTEEGEDYIKWAITFNSGEYRTGSGGNRQLYISFDGFKQVYKQCDLYTGDPSKDIHIWKGAGSGSIVPFGLWDDNVGSFWTYNPNGSGEWDNTSRYDIPPTQPAYIEVKTKKLPQGIADNLYAFYLRDYSGWGTTLHRMAIYAPTVGSGWGTGSIEKPEYVAHKLKIRKLDPSNSAITVPEGKKISFTLADNDQSIVFNNDITSDTPNSEVIFESLIKEHTYTLTETLALDGYIKNEKQYKVSAAINGSVSITNLDGSTLSAEDLLKYVDVQTVNSQDGTVTTTVVYSMVNAATFKLKKVDNAGNIISAIAGEDIAFKMYEKDNIASEHNSVIGTDGLAEFKNLKFDIWYVLEEISTQHKYSLASDRFAVKVNSKGTITVKKLVGTEMIELKATDILALENVGTGTYTFKNLLKQPNTSKFAVSKRIKGIEADGTISENVSVSFKLTKNEDNTFIPIELTKRADETFVFENLTAGDYILEETNAPDGYVKSDELFNVNVDTDGTVKFSVNGVVKYEITKAEQSDFSTLTDNDNLVLIGNIQNPRLKLIKYDTHGDKIVDSAKFRLYKVADNLTENDELIIDETNFVQEFNLVNGEVNEIQKAKLLGKYALVETEAPTGYRKLEKPVLMELYEDEQVHYAPQMKKVTRWRILTKAEDEVYATFHTADVNNDNTVEIHIKNIPDIVFEYPKTGGPGTLMFTLSGAAIMLSAVIFFMINKKRIRKKD